MITSEATTRRSEALSFGQQFLGRFDWYVTSETYRCERCGCLLKYRERTNRLWCAACFPPDGLPAQHQQALRTLSAKQEGTSEYQH